MSDDRGSVTAFFAVAAVGLFVMAGLVVDGGGKVRAMQRADRLAAEAGRVAGQQIDLAAAVGGAPPRVDGAQAIAAARAYLSAAGATGTVEISEGRQRLTITVHTSTRTVFLGLVGVDRLDAQGTATVELVRGVVGEDR